LESHFERKKKEVDWKFSEMNPEKERLKGSLDSEIEKYCYRAKKKDFSGLWECIDKTFTRTNAPAEAVSSKNKRGDPIFGPQKCDSTFPGRGGEQICPKGHRKGPCGACSFNSV